MGKRNRTKRSFTLIELLVVVAIIAVLIAMLLPALAQARDQGRIATCKSNLHQLGISLVMYQSDFKYVPYFFGALEVVNGSYTGKIDPAKWMDRYIPDRRVMLCPGDSFAGKEKITYTGVDDPRYPYLEQRWSLNVPCSYQNYLTLLIAWMGGSWTTVAHGLMLEYSGASGDSAELGRPFGENGQNYTFVRCISDRSYLDGGRRHMGITSIHLTPIGRVWVYNAPGWIADQGYDPVWADFHGWYQADKY